ncbi:ATP-binding protein [Dankookia sp. P2]|uniref:sensor histidine kinase n=1 Tax=Dankookia sp. P2 TaxID=3423955 RepID=UPI003D667620
MTSAWQAPDFYLAAALVGAIATILILRGLHRRRDPFLVAWAAHTASFAFANLGFGLRSSLPAGLAALPTPLALSSLALLWLGIRRLREQAPPGPLWPALLPGLAWLLAEPLLASAGSLSPRVGLYTAIALPLVLGAARECWQVHRARGLIAVRDMTFVLGLVAVWYGWRLAEVLPGTAVPFAPHAGLAAIGIGACFAFLGLTIAREGAALAEAAALRRGAAEMERLHAGLPAVIFLREIHADLTSRHLYRGGDTEAVTGWQQAEIGNLESWAGYTAPDTDIGALYTRALHDGQTRLDWRMRQPGGGWTWLRTHLRILERRTDGSALAVGYIVNIAAERAAADRAETARLMLDSTLAAAPVAVFRGRATPDGGFTRSYLSRGIERLTGWPWEVINAPGGLRAIRTPGTRARVADNMAALIGSGEARTTYQMRRADGSWMWARTTLAVLERFPDGSAEVVGYIADITPEREAEVKAVAAARLASLGEMTSGLAHELMQPLLTMSLASENALRALDRGDAEAARPRLGRIVQQVRRAKELVEHFRRFARGTPADLPPGPVALVTAVEGALVLVGAGLREAGVEVELALGDAPPRVLGHAVPLEQVLVNLLGNARDAMEALPADRPRRVRLSALEAAPGTVTLTVADTAGGIPEAVMARLFEPFVSTKDADRGTGLGLSICHGLVRAMGGEITARNDGAGAVFTITLAAAPPAAEASAA